MKARSTTANARRSRKLRQRRRDGLRELRFDLHYHQLVTAILKSTRLTPAEALSRRNVTAEVQTIMREWIQHWVNTPE